MQIKNFTKPPKEVPAHPEVFFPSTGFLTFYNKVVTIENHYVQFYLLQKICKFVLAIGRGFLSSSSLGTSCPWLRQGWFCEILFIPC
jgi:hypothetical protein